jgi:hypothetical protein
MICLLDTADEPSIGRTVLSIAADLLSFADPSLMNLPVVIDLNAVPGDWRVSCLDEMNLPVEVDLIEVQLFLVLDLPPRNLSSPIPLPGNSPFDLMWNLGDNLVLTLFTSTASLTPF